VSKIQIRDITSIGVMLSIIFVEFDRRRRFELSAMS
jgi:hypothetical protein